MGYNQHVYIGYFTRTRGLKGEIQLFFEFSAYDHLDLSILFVEIEKKLVPFFVGDYQLLSNRTGFFFLEDVNHIDDAEKLIHKNVYLPADKIPKGVSAASKGPDLVGFMVKDSVYGDLGEITEINEFPQQYVATVVYEGKAVMFPLVEEFIVEVDKNRKVFYVSLPTGLIDVYLL